MIDTLVLRRRHSSHLTHPRLPNRLFPFIDLYQLRFLVGGTSFPNRESCALLHGQIEAHVASQNCDEMGFGELRDRRIGIPNSLRSISQWELRSARKTSQCWFSYHKTGTAGVLAAVDGGLVEICDPRRCQKSDFCRKLAISA